MPDSNKIHIFDTTLRDAEQVPGCNLIALRRELRSGLPAATDRMSRFHIEDCIARIEKALDIEQVRQ